MGLRVGDTAPDIQAKDTRGNDFKLSDLRGKKHVVLFFYPRAFTPGCTAEVCSFRDAYEELSGKDTEIVGVSTDDLAQQEKFAEAHHLPYPLLADADKRIAKAYGVMGMFRSILGMAGRQTFLIDKTGIIRGVFHHELAVTRHVEDAKQILATLS